MPCNSDGYEPTGDEIRLSQIMCLSGELNGIPLNKQDWGGGYHPAVYGKGLGKKELDRATANLCLSLKTCDVSKHSLEVQMWWRDHQAADERRIKQEKSTAAIQKIRAAALAKLTPGERAALGLK